MQTNDSGFLNVCGTDVLQGEQERQSMAYASLHILHKACKEKNYQAFEDASSWQIIDFGWEFIKASGYFPILVLRELPYRA